MDSPRATGTCLRAAAICLAGVACAQDAPPLLGDHLERTCAVDREHVHHASVEGTVLGADGKPVAGARVYVYGQLPWHGPLAMAVGTADAGGRYRIDDVEAVGSLTLFATTPRGAPFASGWWSLGLASGRHSRLRPATLPKPVEGATPHVFRGRLVGAGGKPVAGAMWRLQHADAFDPGAFATTDADGRFEVHSDLGKPNGGTLFAGSVRFKLEHKDGAKDLNGTAGIIESELDLVVERTIEAPAIDVVPLAAPGIDGATFHHARGPRLAPCAGVALLYRSDFGSGAFDVWVRAPGRLPRSRAVPQQQFDVTADQPWSLRVVGDGGAPVAGAAVDVCSAYPGGRLAETTLATFRTGEDGALAVQGPAGDHVVYVYAEGHEPARAVWRAGRALEVVLQRCTARLEVTAGSTESRLYVRRAGTFASSAKVYLHEGENAVDLVPGDYELSVYGERGIEAAVTVAVSGATKIALPAEDRRPELVLAIPGAVKGDDCWAYASRSMTGGMITGWSIYTQRGGPMPRHELVATVDAIDAEPDANGTRRFRLRPPTSGRYTVLAANGAGVRFFRECTFELGRSYSLELPARTGVLRGSVVAYPDAWADGFSMYGVAGPRLCLEPGGTTPFGVLVALPKPAKLELGGLLPGAFTLHHHLYETGTLWTAEGTWGGAPITIAADAPGLGGDLARGPDGELQVEVKDRSGAPATGRLQIRDRMFECWADDLRQNTTLDGAADPIAPPPAADLADGKCKLGHVRTGKLAFVLYRDDGSSVHFTRDVDVGKPLVVALEVLPPVMK